MTTGKKSVWTFTAIAARSLGRIAVNKMFAVFLGAPGIAILGHFQNLIGILIQLPNEGVNRGLAYFLNSDLPESEKKKIAAGALYFNMLLFLIIAGLLLVFRNFFFKFFIASMDETAFLTIFFSAVAVFILNFFLQTFFLSLRNATLYAISNIGGAALLAGAVFWGVNTLNRETAILAFAVGQAASVLVTVFILIRRRAFKNFGFGASWRSFKKLADFGLMAITILLFSKLVDFGVRQYALETYGPHLTGLWQSVVKFSDIYMSLFLSTVGAVYYPQISTLIFDTGQLRKYLRGVFFFVIPLTAAGLLILFLFREGILTLLFAREFIPAQYLVKYQFAGDFFSILSYLLIYIFSAQARTVVFILLHVASAALYVFFIAVFAEAAGIQSIPIAHALRFIAFFLTLVILNRRLLF